MKIRPMGTELFHSDGQPDTTKLTVACSNFAKAPKKKKKGETYGYSVLYIQTFRKHLAVHKRVCLSHCAQHLTGHVTL